MLDLHWAVLQFWEQSVRFTQGSLTVLETKCKIYTGLFYSSGNKVLDLHRTFFRRRVEILVRSSILDSLRRNTIWKVEFKNSSSY